MSAIIKDDLKGFFTASVIDTDPEIDKVLNLELNRQQNEIELIASENIVSRAVLEAQGSVLTNKYAEGYPKKRYYGGCQFVDIAETLAIERAKELFGAKFINVQPSSGSQANQAAFMSLLSPGDKILGMSLASGGHLTHGAKPNQSGKWFEAIQYGVTKEEGLIDYDEVESLALEHEPKLILAGASSYSMKIDFARFREIADKIGAYLMVDMAHYAGIIAGGAYPTPIPHAHIITTTTHKTLRGPRGGMILTNDADIAKKVNSAVFPGMQGGPLMHVIAAKAIAFKEALKPEFKDYAFQVCSNAITIAKALKVNGFDIVSNGTESHMFLLDLRPKHLTGKLAEKALGRANITVNKNAVPFDPQKPFVTSGLRIGVPATTTRGFKEQEMELVAKLITEVLDGLVANGDEGNGEVENSVKQRVIELTSKFPIY